MKVVLNVCNMSGEKDVNRVRTAISGNEGVIACKIDSDKKQVEIIYDGSYITKDDIINSLDEKGYIVI